MSGSQHPFPPGFPGPPQNTMRNQFGGGQMVPGLMGPQQGMMNTPQFGPGMSPGVGPSPLGMMSPQQQTNQPVPAPAASQIAVPHAQPQPQRPANKDLNTASLCKLGQETVQDIVARTQELFQILRVVQPPNGTPQGQTLSHEKKTKIQEQIKNVSSLFKRLRMIYEKCNENCQLQGMEYTHIESLIPIKEEWDMKSDEKKASEAYRLACEEHKEVIEQLVLKNRQMKEMVDHLRKIILEINTMLSMRRS
ncbi:hypothetical protein QAD02_001209 [Eretmocerus hayati]|uniref:Uncharacterized protein n=1 Tax=Eretmocerus hayati TaxID=131215 RepID=A0ACC2NFL5_9HYME|nr:hypothetical protein QAD02_001209 [Eretmocerus hayati]